MSTTDEANTELREFSDIIAELTDKPALPRSWVMGWKAVRPDLTTKHGFRWYPGTTVRSDHNIHEDNGDVCPSWEGDGLCLAKTLSGAASAGFPSLAVVSVWYDPANVLAESQDKMRLRGELLVGEVFDVARLGRDGHLSGAHFSGANLSRANLSRAYLYRANLSGADLYGADLSGADLYGANLYGAYLSGADLYGANLSGAYLYGADLSMAHLSGANLSGARYSDSTTWPVGFDVESKVLVKV